MINALQNLITVNQAWHYKVIPFDETPERLQMLIAEDTFGPDICNELQVILGRKIQLVPKQNGEIERLLSQQYPRNQNSTKEFVRINDINIVEKLLLEAKDLNSSDIHIESYGDKCRIRFRIDGALIDRHAVSKSDYPTLVNKIKIAAGCDIGEKRLPQDGRIRIKNPALSLDVRVSILPTLYSEKIVLRLLNSDTSHLKLSNLGFSEDEYERYSNAMRKPHGIILISGPTGSGKTTTLYATLKELNLATDNILTIEDPIEYTLDGINQVQLREDIGLTYPSALRTFLRQDPDIIMLGEIRDAETAQMAIRAALTGHLVLSTIHTNSAWGTISRLIEMGIPGYLLASTINLSVAQRLVRLLCPQCRRISQVETDKIPAHLKSRTPRQQFAAVGCEKCYYSGFRGRRPIYEVLPATKEFLVLVQDETADITDYLKREKINTLSDNAFRLYAEGWTTLEEVYPYLIN
jgi:type IV pilus assembly protein PilB